MRRSATAVMAALLMSAMPMTAHAYELYADRRNDLQLSRLSVVVQDLGFRSAIAGGGTSRVSTRALLSICQPWT